ncbi:MAG: ATP-binding protein [Chthoniobacter sp.]|uniref:sensor histidine kinase n=1 Tax=Chthoniobacter sp. TaxID=2510640 RepID=UPI0032A84141
MPDFIRKLFSSDGFMPHGHCYLWTPGVVWLHVVSDTLIALAYYSIPLTLAWFVRRRKDIDFRWMFVCFAVFILACGTTHLMEIWNVWHGNYWLSGMVKALTAAASVPTAILLTRLMPQALALPSPSTLARLNVQLEEEVQMRRRAQDELYKLNSQLEHRVAERTAELNAANANLQRQIAERKRAEEEVKRLNAELEARVSQRTVQLEAANRELEAFSYSVSHDLRAPLRAVDGFSEAVLADCGTMLPEKGQRHLQRIRAGAQRMGALIDDLLTFSRLSRLPLAKRPVDMTKLVRETIDELAPQQEGRQVELLCGDLPMGHGDPALVKQIWINLLSNALKYTRKREIARIDIGCKTEQHEQVYFVRDNGTGFDMRYADKLFGVFQRLHRAEEYEGTGVGLAIVQRIVHRHGGRIWVEAQENQGATFYFTLEEEQPS